MGVTAGCSMATSVNGIITIRIAFSWTCQPNRNAANPQRVNDVTNVRKGLLDLLARIPMMIPGNMAIRVHTSVTKGETDGR